MVSNECDNECQECFEKNAFLAKLGSCRCPATITNRQLLLPNLQGSKRE